MKHITCIFTVIKNEHEYLDEWIRYHLNLGIDHIFIFEDYDSLSHESICNKYKDKVSLLSIFNILNEDDKQKAIYYKNTKKGYVHPIYIRNGLSYIKNNFKLYDWCFVIDIDEFITLENNNESLDNILDLYTKYDAFIMAWKHYGANGLILKPDYSNKGVLDTYIKESKKYLITNNAKHLVKTCYNIKKYNEEYPGNTHMPSNACNWCNSSLCKYIDISLYRNIYLRHYITKSWEEYIWKKHIRGYMWGVNRNYDLFFKINPDMNSKKNELIEFAENYIEKHKNE